MPAVFVSQLCGGLGVHTLVIMICDVSRAAYKCYSHWSPVFRSSILKILRMLLSPLSPLNLLPVPSKHRTSFFLCGGSRTVGMACGCMPGAKPIGIDGR